MTTFPTSALAAVAAQAASRPPETVRMGLLAYELTGAVLGVFVAYLAYRGYRRNQSRPMLFVSLGFLLALGAPLAVTLTYTALPITGGRVAVQVINQTFEVVGLLSIIYGLRT